MFSGTPFDRPPHCEVCERLESECICPAPVEHRTPTSKQQLKLVLEYRKGKRTVTTVRGLIDEGSHVAEVLTFLKSTCGAGGTIQEGIVEIQGDHRDRIATALTQRGYRVKVSP